MRCKYVNQYFPPFNTTCITAMDPPTESDRVETEQEPLPLMDSNLYADGWGRIRPAFRMLRPDSPPGALLDSQSTENIFLNKGRGSNHRMPVPDHLTSVVDGTWNGVLQEPIVRFQSNMQPSEELRMPQYVNSTVGRCVFGGQGG